MAKRARKVTLESDAAAAELRAMARAVRTEAISALLDLARDAKSEAVRLAAIKELLDRGFGRAGAGPSEEAAGITTHLLVDDGYAN